MASKQQIPNQLYRTALQYESQKGRVIFESDDNKYTFDKFKSDQNLMTKLFVCFYPIPKIPKCPVEEHYTGTCPLQGPAFRTFNQTFESSFESERVFASQDEFGKSSKNSFRP